MKALLQRVAAAMDKGYMGHNHAEYSATLAAVRAAIEQPESEPVAWATRREDGGLQLFFLKASAERESFCQMNRVSVLPLYLAAGASKPGYQLVPIEPTEAMCKAYANAKYEDSEDLEARNVWKEMLGALQIRKTK